MKLEKRGRTGGREGPHLQPAGGRLRQPGRDLQVRGGGLRSQRMPARLAGGDRHPLLQLRRHSEHDPRHGSGLQHARPSTKTKPPVWRSSRRPSTSRSESRSRCAAAPTTACGWKRPASRSRSRSRRANFTIWGFPADPEHDIERFHPGEPGDPPGCPGARLDRTAFPARIRRRANCRSPSSTTRASAPVRRCRSASTRSATRTRTTSRISVDSYPETTGCENQRFDPVFNLGLTTGEADAPSGLDIAAAGAPVPRGRGADPIEPALGDADAAARADGQPRCRRRPDLLHRRAGGLRLELARATVPTTRRSAPSTCARRRSTRRSTARSTSANRSRATSTGCS